MKYRLVLEFINLFFAGILAGIEIAAHYGFHAPTVMLDEKPQILLRQGVVRRLRWLVPAFFMPTALSGIALALLDGLSPGVLFRGVALLAVFLWILVRIAGTVRINSATLDWNPDSPPQDWKKLLAAVERFHLVGVGAALLVFVSFLLAMALRLTSIFK